MTLGTLRQLISLEMVSDRRSNPDLFFIILSTAMRDVATHCIPRSLLSIEAPASILRKVICDDHDDTTDDVRYIRVPVTPVDDIDILDIDDLLCMAVLYGMCHIMSQDRKEEFNMRMHKEINKYQWVLYEEVDYGCNN